MKYSDRKNWQRLYLYAHAYIIARPKDGLFRLHTSWIYLSYAGFDCLAAILCH